MPSVLREIVGRLFGLDANNDVVILGSKVHFGRDGAQVSFDLSGATFTVMYDSGWPASRPAAPHVHAIGHSSEPPWLTAADVWFEAT
jgi:hypothetical protein